MASVVSNLVYRVSVSAIVGAIVAGGLIYINNDRVIKSYRAEQSTQTEQQAMTNKALMEANEILISSIEAIEAENAQRLSEIAAALSALEVKIDMIPAPESADYSEITVAIVDLQSGLNAKMEILETKISALQEQN